MAEVDFSDMKQAEVWFAKQTIETRCAMACRAAVRVLASCVNYSEIEPSGMEIAALRASLVSACYGSGRPNTVDWGRRAEFAAGVAGHASRESSADSAFDAACEAAETIFGAIQHPVDAIFSAAHAAAYAENPLIDAEDTTANHGARTAANTAAGWDARHAETLFDHPVWAEVDKPFALAENHRRLISHFQEHEAWKFWLRFYEGMWNGTFTEWDLAFKVIKIEEEDWEKGYEHIGEVIAGIEARMQPDHLPESEAKAQAVKLVAHPEPAALAAEGVAQLIEMATTEYKREVSNALPDEFEPLENLPSILRNVSLVLTSSLPQNEKEEQLQAALQLATNTVGELNHRLTHCRNELETYQRNGHGRRLFADAFYEKSGERVAELLTSKILWGGLISGAGFVLGGGSAEALTTGLQECFQTVVQPETQEALKPITKPI